jgi:hypothetical protein
MWREVMHSQRTSAGNLDTLGYAENTAHWRHEKPHT